MSGATPTFPLRASIACYRVTFIHNRFVPLEITNHKKNFQKIISFYLCRIELELNKSAWYATAQ